MKWHFPAITMKTTNSDSYLLDKVLEEMIEFENETNLSKKAEEAIDILHSSETLVRQFFLKYPTLSIKRIKKKVIIKNKKRSYYKHNR